MKSAFLLPAFFAFALLGAAQSQDSLLVELEFHADVMTNASRAEHRERAGKAFRTGFVQLLGAEGSYNRPLDSLVWVQRITPADSSFRLFTWQVESATGQFSYFGVLQKNDGQMIQLSDRRTLNSEYARYDQNTWYGAIYYDIHTLQIDGKDAYLVLGYDANTPKTNQRVADILQLEGDAVSFGAPVFDVIVDSTEVDTKSRIVIKYADGATGRMRIDRERDLLVYDNIVVINAGPEGAKMVPDGSYSAFDLSDGQLVYIDKLYTRTVDTPPGEGLKKSDRDLFGNPKKN